MKLKELIEQSLLSKISDDISQIEIANVVADSRQVKQGSLFVAVLGSKTHGDKFVEQAIEKGAKVIVSQQDVESVIIPKSIVHLKVADPNQFLVQALKKYHNDPSGKICLIGITGTNGKTTITYLLEKMLAVAQKSCGVIGTVNHRFGSTILNAVNTTPGIVDNYELLGRMVLESITCCAMEVSSHALDQRRVEGLDFRYGIFTNLTSDHLDYHKDQESYFLAKAKLFTNSTSRQRSIINIDDDFGLRLRQMTETQVWTYAINQSADFMARNIELGFSGTRFQLVTPIGVIEISTALIGLHNVYNILSVAAVGVGEGIALDLIKKGIEALPQVPGRLERIDRGQNFHVFVDYAHTEDALKNVLTSLRAVKKTRIIVVFGCGGDRDKTKRPRMAHTVEELSDFAIVTTDNPRSEDPQQIINEILEGFKKKNFEVVLDRRQAIGQALALAKKDEVVLIAGKGHESYQIFHDKTIAFDERKIVADSIFALGKI